jgi:hypothetical protein
MRAPRGFKSLYKSLIGCIKEEKSIRNSGRLERSEGAIEFIKESTAANVDDDGKCRMGIEPLLSQLRQERRWKIVDYIPT